MTLRHLRIFIAVCEAGKITDASKKLYLAQPSVSNAISELEEYYGVKLFDRISRKLYITESGKQLLQYATHIVELFDETEYKLKNNDNFNVLKIGCSVSIASIYLPQILKEFKKLYPNIETPIYVNTSKNIEEMILSNKIDIGIGEGVIDSQFIEVEKIFNDKLTFICGNEMKYSNKTIKNIKELKNENFILRESGSGARDILSAELELTNSKLDVNFESVSNTAIISAVKENLGISFLPFCLVEELINKKEISRFYVQDINTDRNIYLIHHKNKFVSFSLEKFSDVTFKYFENIK